METVNVMMIIKEMHVNVLNLTVPVSHQLEWYVLSLSVM